MPVLPSPLVVTYLDGAPGPTGRVRSAVALALLLLAVPFSGCLGGGGISRCGGPEPFLQLFWNEPGAYAALGQASLPADVTRSVVAPSGGTALPAGHPLLDALGTNATLAEVSWDPGIGRGDDAHDGYAADHEGTLHVRSVRHSTPDGLLDRVRALFAADEAASDEDIRATLPTFLRTAYRLDQALAETWTEDAIELLHGREAAGVPSPYAVLETDAQLDARGVLDALADGELAPAQGPGVPVLTSGDWQARLRVDVLALRSNESVLRGVSVDPLDQVYVEVATDEGWPSARDNVTAALASWGLDVEPSFEPDDWRQCEGTVRPGMRMADGPIRRGRVLVITRANGAGCRTSTDTLGRAKSCGPSSSLTADASHFHDADGDWRVRATIYPHSHGRRAIRCRRTACLVAIPLPNGSPRSGVHPPYLHRSQFARDRGMGYEIGKRSHASRGVAGGKGP